MPIRPRQESGWPVVTGGTKKKLNPFVGDNGFLKTEGFHLDESGALTKWNGFSKYNTTILQESAVNAQFTGLFDYVKSDGTRIPVATALSGIYRYGSPVSNAWNALSLTSAGGNRTGTVNDYYDFVVLRDILYASNGVNGNLKYDGTDVHNMGVTAPSSAATAALGAAGVLTGNYSYKITFYNSAKAHESNPSAASNTVTASSSRIDLTGIPVSSDAQVNRRRIYRTTTGGGVWLFLAEIADNTTTIYTDNAADSTLGIQIEEFANGVPPSAAIMEVYKGRVFSVQKDSSRVWFSKQNFPNAVHSNDFRDLDPDDGDAATGLRRLYGQIIAFKNDSIWNGFGDDRNTFAFERQVNGIGSVNNVGIVAIPGRNALMFVSEDGFYSYDGISEQKESDAIDPVFKGLNQSRLKYAYGFVYKPKNVLAWLVSDGSSTQHDLIVMYDYRQSQWMTRPIPNTKANVAQIIEDANNNEIFYIGGYGGHVWQGDSGQSDDGAAIACELIDRAHPRPDSNPEMKKSFYELIVWFKPQNAVTVTAAYALDDPDAAFATIGTVDISKAEGQYRMRIPNAIGHRFFPKFTNSATGQPLTLRGWRVYYKTLGRVA